MKGRGREWPGLMKGPIRSVLVLASYACINSALHAKSASSDFRVLDHKLKLRKRGELKKKRKKKKSGAMKVLINLLILTFLLTLTSAAKIPSVIIVGAGMSGII